MMILISKGVPYNTGMEDSIFKVWHEGHIISLTHNQKIIWTFLYGTIRTYKDLMKFMLKLFNNGTPMSKQTLTQTLTQLKSLGLISYLDSLDVKEGEFILLFKNKIKPLKDVGLEDNFQVELFHFIKNNQDFSVADFISMIDNKHYEKLTNGFDEDYIKYMYTSIHSKITLETVKKFLQNGVCYVA